MLTFPLVDAPTLQANLGSPSLKVVDARFVLADGARGFWDYQAGHLPGATYLDLAVDLSGPVVPGKTGRHPLPDPGLFSRKLGASGISSGDTIVVYDAQDGSMAAARAWWLLRWLGHDAVTVLDGGLAAWRAQGGTLTTEIPKRAEQSFVPRVRQEMVASREEVSRRARRGDGLLWDARSAERFRGDVEPIDKKAGHIPSSCSVPFLSLTQQGRFLPKLELGKKVEVALAGRSTTDLIVYCGSGVTACHLLLGLESAGCPGARLYPGSWSEWIVDDRAPVALGPEPGTWPARKSGD